MSELTQLNIKKAQKPPLFAPPVTGRASGEAFAYAYKFNIDLSNIHFSIYICIQLSQRFTSSDKSVKK